MSADKVRLVREIDGVERVIFVGPNAVGRYLGDGWAEQDAPPPAPRPSKRRPAPSPAPSGPTTAPSPEED